MTIGKQYLIKKKLNIIGMDEQCIKELIYKYKIDNYTLFWLEVLYSLDKKGDVYIVYSGLYESLKNLDSPMSTINFKTCHL